MELADASADTPLRDLPRHPNRSVTVVGVRLPGWTGGKGFFLDDGQSYVIAVPAGKIASPKVWQPVTVRGRWQSDPWGGGVLMVEEIGE